MRKFWGFYDNGTYRIGCNGGTMYLYDSENNELAKFKDIPYAYRGAFKPNSNIFWLRSTEGRIAVYDCDERKMLHKFKFSDVNSSQDDGFCFSDDGKLFFNIERIGSSTRTRLSIYETQSFSPVKRMFEGNKLLVLDEIEYNASVNQYILLFFMRNSQGVYDQGYVGKLDENQISDITPISSKVFDFLSSYKSLQSSGFTEKSMEWSRFRAMGYTYDDMNKIKDMNIDFLSFPQAADKIMKE